MRTPTHPRGSSGAAPLWRKCGGRLQLVVRNGVLGQDIWDKTCGGHCQMYKAQYGSELFDDSLFQKDILPVPGLTMEDILATL